MRPTPTAYKVVRRAEINSLKYGKKDVSMIEVRWEKSDEAQLDFEKAKKAIEKRLSPWSQVELWATFGVYEPPKILDEYQINDVEEADS